MRVNPSQTQATQASETAASREAKKAERLKTQSGSTEATSISSDSAKTDISSKAKQMARAKQVAADAPDVREEKIAALRTQIQNKQYKVDANKVADRLVDEHLSAPAGA